MSDAGAPEPKTVDDNPLADIEAEHGFTFGTPEGYETAEAVSDKTLICATLDCPQQNRQVAVHVDTVLPIHCGGCGQVLYCQHNWQTENRTVGTLANPILVVQETCTVCNSQLPAVETALPPIDIASLPVSVIASLINSPAQ